MLCISDQRNIYDQFILLTLNWYTHFYGRVQYRKYTAIIVVHLEYAITVFQTHCFDVFWKMFFKMLANIILQNSSGLFYLLGITRGVEVTVRNRFLVALSLP